jgi:methylglutaconyl-CoA hydratase
MKVALFKPKTILIEREGAVGTIILNKPKKKNAMDLEMIRELSTAFQMLDNEEKVRLIVLSSQGEIFCAGADLNWMRSGMNQTEVQLQNESLELALLFRTIWETSTITISAVKGRILGGAIGLLAASDFVVAERSSTLGFSEVKLGLVPATISPYVLRKAGFGRCTDWMMTGRLIHTREAQESGIIHRVCEDGMLTKATNQLVEELLSNAPQALRGVKKLLRDLENEFDPDKLDQFTSQLVARFRASKEGLEGMNAFLEKRKPRWHETP